MRTTVRTLRQWKTQGEKFVMLTAYDYTMARLLSQAGIQLILVGDSLGQVVLGYASTLPVTVAEMIHHAKAVVRGAGEAMVVVDMPFLSYQVSIEDAIRNCGRVLKQTGAQAVKIEGGEEMADTVAALTRAGIAVMGHVGLRPQAINQVGSYATQATDEAGVQQLLADAQAIAAAGAFALVVEKVAPAAGGELSRALAIPVIGCGSGPECDGQVLVTYDLLGLFPDFTPSFVKRYAELGNQTQEALRRFQQDVKDGVFPASKEKEKNSQ